MGRPWNWKDWFAQTDRQARELVQAIDNGQRDARHRGDAKPPAQPQPGKEATPK
jgi:hypothetical protein